MRTRLLRVLLAAALLLPACSSSGGDVGIDPENGINPLFEVRQMLRTRGAALVQGNVEAFLKNVGPEALAAEEVIGKGGASVPLAKVDFIFNPPRRVGLSSEVFNDVETELRYHYRGLAADNYFQLGLIYSVSKIRGAWTITKSQVNPKSPQVPDWARGPVSFKSTNNFLAIYRPGLPLLDESLKAADEAKKNLSKKLSLPVDERQVMFLAKDHAEFASMSNQSEADVEGVLAEANYYATGKGGAATGRQIIADLAALFPRPGSLAVEHGEEIPASQVFQHELGHLALSRYRADLHPLWVTEGAAMYLSGEKRIAAWQQLSQRGLLETDLTAVLVGEIAGESVIQSPYLYPYANAAVNYLVEKYGAQRFWDFYKRFTRVPVTADSQPEASIEATNYLLTRVYGTDTQELDQGTKDWIKKQLEQT